MLGIAGALDGDGRGQRGGVEAVLGQHRGGGGLEQLGQIGGGHGGPSYGLGWSAPESSFRRPRSDSRCDSAGGHALGCPRPTAPWLSMRPRSSGDRASASGAEGRRFESCRGHSHLTSSEHVSVLITPRHASSVLFDVQPMLATTTAAMSSRAERRVGANWTAPVAPLQRGGAVQLFNGPSRRTALVNFMATAQRN